MSLKKECWLLALYGKSSSNTDIYCCLRQEEAGGEPRDCGVLLKESSFPSDDWEPVTVGPGAPTCRYFLWAAPLLWEAPLLAVGEFALLCGTDLAGAGLACPQGSVRPGAPRLCPRCFPFTLIGFSASVRSVFVLVGL